MSKILVLKLCKLRFLRVTLISTFFIGLTSCASDFSAPVSERSEKMVITSPVIVMNSEFDINDRLNSRSTNSPADVRDQSTYTVRKGDNLISIAFRYDLDFRLLATANQLKPPYTIFVDQKLDLDVRNISETQSIRNNSLGVEAPSNAVAKTQAASGQSRGIVRESITKEEVVQANGTAGCSR